MSTVPGTACCVNPVGMDSSEVSTKTEVLASPNSLSRAQAPPGAACGTIRNDETLMQIDMCGEW